MDKPFYGSADPIAAFATPLGESALAVIRTSGAGVVELLSRVFSRPEKLREAAGNTVIHGWIVLPAHSPAQQKRLDETLVSVYRGPHSYTGEDGADISCHGGIAAARAVMDALKGSGFREALPGEFTFRAFMNGKLDLTRAESVMEIVSAKTERSREHAAGRLSGVLEQEIRAISALLVDVLGAAELYLDYSEDEADSAGEKNGSVVTDEEAGRLPARRQAEEGRERLQALAASYGRERLYADGALVVIAGRPNAGKSSLFNCLVKEERSIVTDIPGTTRDWIEGWISLEGIPVRLVDTAGLHNSENPVELLGMERSRDLLRQADLVLYLIDGNMGITGEDRDFLEFHSGAMIVWNKADIAPLPRETETRVKPVPISAKTGAGMADLTGMVASALETAVGGPGKMIGGRGISPTGIGTARQKELVDTALAAVEEALALADRGEPLDLIAPLLREGVAALGEITGEVSTADILEAMFSRFCVGK
jgi:tRNA modification GTPase